MRSAKICTALLVGCLALVCIEGAEGAVVTLDGEALYWPIFSPGGRTGEACAGDLVRVRLVWIRLMEDADLHLRTEKRSWGRVLTTGSPPRPVAVMVEEEHTGNPLGEFSPGERRGLQGVYVGECPEGAADWLSGLDPARCAVTLARRRAPTLPRTIRYLVIRTEDQIEPLRPLTDLRALIVEGPLRLPASLVGEFAELRGLRVLLKGPSTAELANLTKLRNLDLRGAGQCPDYAFLKSLPELRVLSLAHSGVSDLACLKPLRKLVDLDVSLTSVESLRPLGDHLELRRIDATFSQVELLPDEALPRLKLIEAVGTGISDEEAARFRDRNRRCVLHCRWRESLLHAVKGATSLKVRTVGNGRKVRFETSDAAVIAGLLATLDLKEIRASRNGCIWSCACGGSHTLEFGKGDTLLAIVSIHHGVGLRWAWPSDAALTPAGAARLQEWMKVRGIDIAPPRRR